MSDAHLRVVSPARAEVLFAWMCDTPAGEQLAMVAARHGEDVAFRPLLSTSREVAVGMAGVAEAVAADVGLGIRLVAFTRARVLHDHGEGR